MTFTQDNITLEEVPDAALASSSIPGWFQPRPFKGMLLMDGGTVYNTDVTNGILGCLNQGYDETDIVVDIAICGDINVEAIEDSSRKAAVNYQRGKDLKKSLTSGSSVAESMRAYPNANYRNLFLEMDPSSFPLDFRSSATWPLQQQGRGLA